VGVKELGHIVLYVRDVRRSAAFYRDVLGFRQIFPLYDEEARDNGDSLKIQVDGAQRPPRSPLGVPIAAFSSGRTHHELLLIEVGESAQPVPSGCRLGMYHFGLKVGDSDEELREMWRRVEAAGAEVVGASDHTVSHSLYVRDPDGNEIELYVDVPGVDWQNHPELVASPIRPLAL